MPFGAVAKYGKHDLLFLWTLRFLVGIVSNGIAADISKKLREFFTTVCVDSFLFFDVWIGSLCSLLFFSGHFSFDFSKQIGYMIYMSVSENGGTPKSSILIGFSIIFTIHFGVPLFLETPI